MARKFKPLFENLSPENKKTIKKMKCYLKTHHINEIVFEDIISDIIGMAIESQKRGENFSDSVGMEYETFCRELVLNSPKQSFLEKFLDTLRYLLICGLCIIPILFVIKLIFPQFAPGNTSGFRYTAPAAYILKYCIFAFITVVGWYLVRRYVYKYRPLVITIYFSVLFLYIIMSDILFVHFFKGVFFEINIILWIILFSVLLLICIGSKRLAAFTVAYKNKSSNN